jgi:RNA-binding protein YlmH
MSIPMTDEEALLLSRFIELGERSTKGRFVFTDFLGLAEQSVLTVALSELRGVKYTLFGGSVGTERVMARFGDEEELYYSEPFPISTVRIAPRSQKFANALTHRDFLGAMLNLGIERRCVGDIAIVDNVGYVFLKDDVASFVAESLTKVKHTDVTCALTTVDELPKDKLYRTEWRRIQLSSERIDAVVAKVFNLSRDDSQLLIKRALVFVNGRAVESASLTPKDNDVISVRGHGRFIYHGASSLSKKGKLNADVELYV